MVYAADGPATALVETLVHAGRADLLEESYVLFEISLDEERHLYRLSPELLPPNWQAWPWPTTTQEIGTYWSELEASVVLEVPSAVVPFHRNYLINAQHPDFAELEIVGPANFPIDPRLVRPGPS